MNYYWVTFANRGAGCIDAESLEGATTSGDMIGAVVTVKCLPYPARPRLLKKSECPEFCYRPGECAGKTSCPRPYACSE